jgi:hypothetical protein
MTKGNEMVTTHTAAGSVSEHVANLGYLGEFDRASAVANGLKPEAFAGYTIITSHGEVQGTWGLPGCTPNSVVMVSISEVKISPEGQVVPNLGDASCVVQNVVPGTDSSSIRCYVGWKSDLTCRLNVFMA